MPTRLPDGSRNPAYLPALRRVQKLKMEERRARADGESEKVDERRDKAPSSTPEEGDKAQVVEVRGGDAFRSRPRRAHEWGRYTDQAKTKGVAEWLTTDGLPVQTIHYSAARRKDPDTEEGRAWRREEVIGYPGGLTGPKWLQEMELRFDVRDTSRVFPDWDEMVKDVTCPPLDVRQHADCPIYLCYDYGYDPGATAICPLIWLGPEDCVQFGEIYVKQTSVAGQMELLKERPWFERVRETYADPSIWARTQQSGAFVTSIADIFEQEYGLQMTKGQNFAGSDAAFVHLLKSVLWEKGAVKFRIATDCPHTLQEFRTLAWDLPKNDMSTKQPEERVQTRNVHCFQALKYGMLDLWQGTGPTALPPAPGSVDWEIEEMQRMAERAKYVLNS